MAVEWDDLPRPNLLTWVASGVVGRLLEGPMRPGPRREGAHARRGCPKKLFICRLACLPQVCHSKLLWFERMQLTRGDTQHPQRLAPQDRRPRRRSWPIPAATQPARPILVYPPPAPAFGTEKQLTAPADRPVRESAHAVAFTTVVAIRGAGSVHRRTGMQTARALAADSGRPGSQDPRLLLAAGQTHPRRCRSITFVARPTPPVHTNRLCRQQEADGSRAPPPPRAAARMHAFRRGARQRRPGIED